MDFFFVMTSIVCLGFPESVSKNRLERNQTQSGRHSQSLNAIVHLQLVIYVRKVKIDRSFGNDQFFSGLFAAVSLSD